MNTYKVRVDLEIEAENYDEAEEKAMFAINDNIAYRERIEIIDVLESEGE